MSDIVGVQKDGIIESSSNEMDNAVTDVTVNAHPPYYEGFIKMVSHVIRNAGEQSVQDVTQTCWAMSRFNLFVHDAYADKNVEPLLPGTNSLIYIQCTQTCCITMVL